MTEWHPLETAPIGKPVLLWWPEGDLVVVGEIDPWPGRNGETVINIKPHGFSGYEWEWDWGYGKPTHWAERPEGPKS